MQSTIMKLIEYSLLTTTLSEPECRSLIKPVHDIVLTRARICRKITLTVWYRPKDYGCLGFRNIFVKQEIEKLVLYLEKHKQQSMLRLLL